MKKICLTLVLAIFLIHLIAAESVSIEFPNSNEFEVGEAITFKATIYDDSGNPVNGEIAITIEDSERKVSIERTIPSKEVSVIDLGEGAAAGQGVIKASYNGKEYFEFFKIGERELAKFEIEDSKLIVTNIGNIKYSRAIKITIGETEGVKEPELDIGESISYRLIAPEGTYNIKVSDGPGGANDVIRSNVLLSGTGQVIGAIDESTSGRSPVTGGISPDEGSEGALLSYVKSNTFVYVFILVIFGAMILIAIERRYRKKASR